ncbi:cyclin-B1-2 protein [Spatholobus suberectus]|nr:cyclin-B1-2 protein [Spatholobus suberectus]
MNEVMKRQSNVNLYGTAFPLKMDLDRQILSRYYPMLFPEILLQIQHFDSSNSLTKGVAVCLTALFVCINNVLNQRPPGAITSSMLGLEASTGSLDALVLKII